MTVKGKKVALFSEENFFGEDAIDSQTTLLLLIIGIIVGAYFDLKGT